MFDKYLTMYLTVHTCIFGLPQWLNDKESASSLIPGSGRSPGKGNGNPFQYSCLGNPMDREALWAMVHEVTKELDTTQQLNNNIYLYPSIHNICIYAQYCMIYRGRYIFYIYTHKLCHQCYYVTISKLLFNFKFKYSNIQFNFTSTFVH